MIKRSREGKDIEKEIAPDKLLIRELKEAKEEEVSKKKDRIQERVRKLGILTSKI